MEGGNEGSGSQQHFIISGSGRGSEQLRLSRQWMGLQNSARLSLGWASSAERRGPSRGEVHISRQKHASFKPTPHVMTPDPLESWQVFRPHRHRPMSCASFHKTTSLSLDRRLPFPTCRGVRLADSRAGDALTIFKDIASLTPPPRLCSQRLWSLST